VGLFTFYFGVFGGFKCEQITPQIFRGSAPTQENLRELKAMGIKTIISVRTNSTPKRARLCKQLGLNFFHIKTGVFHIPKDKEIEQFLSIVENPNNLPVYICCILGTDRTACYSAIYRVAEHGWTADHAYEEQVEKGLKEWWPIFRKYTKTLQIVETRRQQLARAKAPDVTASGSTIAGSLRKATEQVNEIELPITHKKTADIPAASEFLGTTRRSVQESEGEPPKKSGTVGGTGPL